MAIRTAARVALLVILPLWIASAEAETPTGNPVFDRTVQIVEQNFYAPAALPAFREAVADLKAEAAQRSEPFVLDDAIDRILASLKSSHTARYTQDRVDYYELTDVFRGAVRRDIRRLFPPEGEVTYEGIGVASKSLGGKVFVTDVYDGGPAARAGILAGDEILSADGQPFAEIDSFKGKVGQSVKLELRRTANATPLTIATKVERLQPLETFLKAIEEGARIVEHDGRKIAVVHLWSYTSDEVTNILNRLIATDLKDADGLILDLRSRWGGAPADAGEVFVGDTGDMTMTERDGDIRYVNTRWHKPVVAIIDEGTRSGMEVLTYALKKNGIPLVGSRTAGALVAGTGYLLPDDSLLVLAVADVHLDGTTRLEGNGVEPDIAVPFDVRYAAGRDPQMDAALGEMSRQLSAGSVN